MSEEQIERKYLDDLYGSRDMRKWYPERGSIWRTLENKRLNLEKNGHTTIRIRSIIPTEEDEREYEFWHQLPKGNPNLLPGLPKEYVK